MTVFALFYLSRFSSFNRCLFKMRAIKVSGLRLCNPHKIKTIRRRGNQRITPIVLLHLKGTHRATTIRFQLRLRGSFEKKSENVKVGNNKGVGP